MMTGIPKVRTDEIDDELRARLYKEAKAAHGCGCNYCCYRAFERIHRRPDPGVNAALSPAGCREPRTVKLRRKSNPAREARARLRKGSPKNKPRARSATA